MKCRVVLPEWLDGESLAEVLKEERAQEGTFQDLPFHYVEIATLLLKTAGDEFVMPDRIRSLVEDIENVRMEKIRRGLQGMSDTVLRGRSVMSTKMNHVGAMEITTVRNFLTQAMNMFYVLSGQEVVGEGGGGETVGGGGCGGCGGGGDGGGQGGEWKWAAEEVEEVPGGCAQRGYELINACVKKKKNEMGRKQGRKEVREGERDGERKVKNEIKKGRKMKEQKAGGG